jgi:hypothetical protein
MSTVSSQYPSQNIIQTPCPSAAALPVPASFMEAMPTVQLVELLNADLRVTLTAVLDFSTVVLQLGLYLLLHPHLPTRNL